MENEVQETESVETPVGETGTPEPDQILEGLSDDSQPEESEEKSEDESTENTEDTADNEEESESETTPEVEQEDQELTPEEARKEEARRRYEERDRVRQERQNRVAEQTQSYVEEGLDETDQRLRAVEVQDYNRTIEHNENTLINEFERVKTNPDLQMFNPESDKFNRQVYEKAIKDYNAGYINYDANGNMVGLKGSLYQHLNETAELFKGAVKSGAFQQVRDSRKMKVKADSKPASQPPKEETKDTIMEALMSEE